VRGTKTTDENGRLTLRLNLTVSSPTGLQPTLFRIVTLFLQHARYGDLLRDQELVDFAFLQGHALALLESQPDVLAKLREEYQEILVDAYQHTNAAQDRPVLAEMHIRSDFRLKQDAVQWLLCFNDRKRMSHATVCARLCQA
jgi:hypothetical protein